MEHSTSQLMGLQLTCLRSMLSSTTKYFQYTTKQTSKMGIITLNINWWKWYQTWQIYGMIFFLKAKRVYLDFVWKYYITNLQAMAPLNSIAYLAVHRMIVTETVKNTNLRISTMSYGRQVRMNLCEKKAKTKVATRQQFSNDMVCLEFYFNCFCAYLVDYLVELIKRPCADSQFSSSSQQTSFKVFEYQLPNLTIEGIAAKVMKKFINITNPKTEQWLIQFIVLLPCIKNQIPNTIYKCLAQSLETISSLVSYTPSIWLKEKAKNKQKAFTPKAIMKQVLLLYADTIKMSTDTFIVYAIIAMRMQNGNRETGGKMKDKERRTIQNTNKLTMVIAIRSYSVQNGYVFTWLYYTCKIAIQWPYFYWPFAGCFCLFGCFYFCYVDCCSSSGGKNNIAPLQKNKKLGCVDLQQCNNPTIAMKIIASTIIISLF